MKNEVNLHKHEQVLIPVVAHCMELASYVCGTVSVFVNTQSQ